MSKNFDAANPNAGPLCCFVCGQEIPGGNWFARFVVDHGRVAMCSPRCAEKFLDQHAAGAGMGVDPLKESVLNAK